MPTFSDEARSLGFDLDERQIRQFEAYRDLIVAAAQRFNLTAVRRPDDIERRHFLEALVLGRTLVERGLVAPESGSRALDIGSGAGLPGLPLKIAWPAMKLALLEAQGKRCEFLRQTVSALNLEEVEVLEGRAETWARHPDHRTSYDLVLARAVAPLSILLEYAMPFLVIGGHLAAPKGSAAARETAEASTALQELGAVLLDPATLAPPGGMKQTLVIVRKVGPTPERYPRRTGIARKRPLA